jgi:4-hydroxy-tetrahydrodipicolinate reductase
VSPVLPSPINVCIAGATGWAGRALVDGVLGAGDMALRSAIARSAGGTDLGQALGRDPMGVPVFASVSDALDGVDVLIDYTAHTVVKSNTMAAIERGIAVVIGASGLSAEDYEEIDTAARRYGVGVIAAGNFSLTAAMALAAASLVARYLPQAEVIDYASATKADAPSGTARELAERIAEIRPPVPGRHLEETNDLPEARGAAVAGIPVHSLRLPSFSVSTEVIFGLPDERLTIRHDAGLSAVPYVSGTLLAVRLVLGRIGLTRGLDTLLFEQAPAGSRERLGR